MGYDVYLAHDARPTCNRIDLNGIDHPPELVHDMAVASMHGEFCTSLFTKDIISLLSQPAKHLQRVQGNEPESQKPEHRFHTDLVMAGN